MAETKKLTHVPKDRVRERANADNEALAKLYGWDNKPAPKKPSSPKKENTNKK